MGLAEELLEREPPLRNRSEIRGGHRSHLASQPRINLLVLHYENPRQHVGDQENDKKGVRLVQTDCDNLRSRTECNA
jgi:hypothetical protein